MAIPPIQAVSQSAAPTLFEQCEINIISLIALNVLPDIVSLCHMRSTCKKFSALNITELQRLYFAEKYPTLSIYLLTQYNGIEPHELKLYTQGDFIFKWCSSFPSVERRRQLPNVDGAPVDFKALVGKGDYIAAFAIAAWIDGPPKFFGSKSNCNSQVVQTALIEKWGYKKALQFTLNLSGKETRANTYLAFIQVGCQKINLPRPTSLEKLQEVQHHGFMLALRDVPGTSDIPVIAVSSLINLLLHRAIGNICYDPDMATDDELSEENEETPARKDIVRQWLSFIPKETWLYGLKNTTDLSWEDMSSTFSIFLELKDITNEDYTDFMATHHLR